MREVILSNGTKIEARPLTRKELREGKKYGLGSLKYEIVADQADEAIDYVLKCAFPDTDLDDFANPDLLKLHMAVMAETYSTPGEEKNSSTSGPGAQTQPETGSAGSAEDGKQ